MEQGFIPALGTPLRSDGSLERDSYQRQIADLIDAGAVAVLALGSMGIGAFVPDGTYPVVVSGTVEAAGGRVPVLVGAMDTSVRRVLDRGKIAAAEGADGIVVTAPYYYQASTAELFRFFRGIADESPVPVYLYDLPGVARVTLNARLVLDLHAGGNIAGIKTGTLGLARCLRRRLATAESCFSVIYSALDTMDVAWRYGIRHILDGMFSCCAGLVSEAAAALRRDDLDAAGAAFDRIISLRDFFVSRGVFRGFTAAMNAIGYSGAFGPDYTEPVDQALDRETKKVLAKLKVL